MWRNISRPSQTYARNSHGPLTTVISADQSSVKSAQRLRVDCTGANRGLFLGILMIIMTIISLVVFFQMSGKADFQSNAAVLMYTTELVLYTLSVLSVAGAAFGFRCLRFVGDHDTCLLDQILLLVALVGVYMFHVFSAICAFYRLDTALGSLVMLSSGIAIFQATIQTLFVLNGLRRNAATTQQELDKPGRQYVTFLVASNTALWAVNSFEVLHSDSSPIAVQFYGTLPWSLITHVSIPLAIFYRYHSTVCLADIWKNAYKRSKTQH